MDDSDDLTSPVLLPSLQVSFYLKIQYLHPRALYFQEALRKTVENLDISVLDRQLAEYVKPDALRRAASLGVRGEVFFPVPCILEQNPFLLGYYRLLLGLSQKELYKKGAFDRFKYLEKRGAIHPDLVRLIPALCSSLVKMAEILVNGIDRPTLDVSCHTSRNVSRPGVK